jgi:hypothetical protein
LWGSFIIDFQNDMIAAHVVLINSDPAVDINDDEYLVEKEVLPALFLYNICLSHASNREIQL